MKQKIILLMLLLFCDFIMVNAQTQFWSDTFEDSGAPSSGTRTPSLTFECGGPTATAYFKRTDLTGINMWISNYSDMQGSKFWAGEDIDKGGGSCVNNSISANQQVTWSNINIAGKTGLSFKGLFAASNTGGWQGKWWITNQGGGQQDFLAFEYRIDGGAWVRAIAFYTDIPESNSGSGQSLKLDTNGDFIGDGAALSKSFSEFSANIVGTGSTLDIRMNCFANASTSQELAVDNFRLFESPSCVAPVVTANPVNRTICNGGNTTFSITASNATAYQWQINTGSGFTNITNSGVYSGANTSILNITGITSNMSGYQYRCVASNGTLDCFTNSNSATLTVSVLSASPAAQTNVACFGGSNGSAAVQVFGGTAPYTYSWSPSGGSQATATGLVAGQYTVTVADANGCSDTQSFTITQPASGIDAMPASQTNIACFGASTGSATVQVTGGAAPYTYSWSPSGGSQATATGLAAGQYTVTVADANGCSDTQSFTITQPASGVNASPAMQTNIACFGGSNGSATVQVSGGSAPYTYSWSPSGGSQATATGLSAGVYVVTVEDSNGCSDTQSFTITQPDALIATAQSQSNVGCNETNTGAATVQVSGGSAPYTYSWSPSGGSQATATGLSAGIYVVTIQDANGCETTESFEISSSAVPVITGSDSETICAGDSFVLEPTVTPADVQGFVGDFAGSNWIQTSNNSNGSIVFSDTNSVMISSNGAGSGSGFNQAVIAMPSNATISFDWSYTTTDGAQWDYPQYSLNGNLSLLSGYSSSGSSSQSGTQTIALEAGQEFGFRMLSTDNQFGAATVTISNFQVIVNQYAWTASNGGVINGVANASTLEVTTAGTYTLTVTNSDGCLDTKNITLTVNTTPLPSGAAAQDFVSDQTLADLNVTGMNLTWYDAEVNGNVLPISTALADETTYYVTQTVNGCESERLAITASIILSSMDSSLCGTTLDLVFYQPILATVVPGATEYEFVLTNGGNMSSFVSTTNQVLLTNFGGSSGFEYGATYQISVRAKVNDVWTSYSAPCEFSTIDAPLTSVQSFCNTTLPNVNSQIYFYHIPQTTAYRYSITNLTTNVETFIETSSRFFILSTATNFDFGTDFSLKCQVKINNVYGDFGPACVVTTPMQVTSLRAEFCNITVNTLGSNLFATTIVGAQAYKFRAQENANVFEVERPDARVTMSMFNGLMPNTQYAVSVAIKINNIWSEFGPSCNVQTPAIPTTQLRPEFCNTTLTTLNQNVYSTIVVGATAYKFKVENNGNVQEIERPDSRFVITFASNIQPNTTYNISVSVFFNNQWQTYGGICTLTTPALPTTQLRSQFCGSSVTSLGSNFYASTVVGATAYRFKTMIGSEGVIVERPDSRCFMSAFAGAMMNQTYPIQVAVKIGENWSDYGAVCNLTVGSIISKEIPTETTANNFEIKAYPNPFASNFTLLLSNENLETNVSIFDMTGKMVQSVKTIENEVNMGESLSAGVYLVNITQGQETKNIRVVRQ